MSFCLLNCKENLRTYKKIELYCEQIRVPVVAELFSESVSGKAKSFINVLLFILVFLIKGKIKSLSKI